MLTINPKDISTGEFHGYMLGAIAPRPIAFASTIDKAGNVNLSPFSFFNAFGSNPPTIIFSPARRVRDNTIKHTLENVMEVDEVVINIVNYNMVEQMSLASTEYDKGVNEFVKSGLTEAPSSLVKPPRVLEAPAAFECKVKQIISMGDQGGAANLIICEVILAHFNENILDADGKIDPFKLDAVARMGGDWYCRANGDALFEIPKPVRNKGIGVDALPQSVRESVIFTGNNIARLGNVEQLPSAEQAAAYLTENAELKELLTRLKNDPENLIDQIHVLAKQHLEAGNVNEAWMILLQIL
ncbi:flavin reductase family protein [Penaeicola halotolerans]|uniref:flavin reductase family protein n=1 Tax=Penaeicola halotolerans TaxID=2793196 RepID=UPI001CF92974|nr:flavin reductase family protein [Penaeicola halotolerans]